MYPYNYNLNNFKGDIYTPAQPGNDRFAGGIIAPLLLGGVAGYAIGQNNYRPYMYYTQPYPYYYNNYYYPFPYPYYRK